MERPRLDGASSVMSLPSMRMAPDVRSSRPAIMRSSVDLPQPEGPTKTTNSPFLMSRLAPGMMTTSPKALRAFLREIVPILFHRSECKTAYKLFLCEPAEHQNGCNGHGGSRRELGPEQAFRA